MLGLTLTTTRPIKVVVELIIA